MFIRRCKINVIGYKRITTLKNIIRLLTKAINIQSNCMKYWLIIKQVKIVSFKSNQLLNILLNNQILNTLLNNQINYSQINNLYLFLILHNCTIQISSGTESKLIVLFKNKNRILFNNKKSNLSKIDWFYFFIIYRKYLFYHLFLLLS